MVKYHLRRSHLQGLSDKYLAQVEDVHSYNLDEVLQLMSKEESLLNADQARLALASFYKVMKGIIEEGSGLNLPIFKMQPSISGVFADADTPFSHSEHQVDMNLSLSKELSELLPHVKVHKEDFQPNLPLISEVLDISTGSKNANIRAGSPVKIEGAHLRITGNNAANGIYFVAQDGSEIKVTDPLIENKPSELIITTPNLTVGSKYTLKLITQYSAGRTLKTSRIGTFSTLLSVV